MAFVEGAVGVEVPTLLARPTHRGGELQFVGAVEHDFVVGPEVALDFNPSAIIDTEVRFYADRLVRVAGGRV